MSLGILNPRRVRLTEVLEERDDLIEGERLGERRHRIDLREAFAVHGRHDDDRDARERRVEQLVLAELPAVHYRHHQVEEDRFDGSAGLEQQQRLAAVRSRQRGESLEMQQLLHHLAEIGVILHYEDRVRHLGATQQERDPSRAKENLAENDAAQTPKGCTNYTTTSCCGRTRRATAFQSLLAKRHSNSLESCPLGATLRGGDQSQCGGDQSQLSGIVRAALVYPVHRTKR